MNPPELPAPPPPHIPPADVLRWCAAAAPELWFPSAAAEAHGVARDALNEPLRVLRQSELVAVGDWVAGRGQGYRLTATGERIVRGGGPVPLDGPVPADEPPDPNAFPPLSGLSLNDRALMTREAFLNPRAAIISPALILVCLVWFAWGLVVAWRIGVPGVAYLRDGESRVLIRLGAIYGPELLNGEWWRLVTAGFVHVGALHLLVNLFSLGVLGPVAEGLWGRKRFIVLYFLSGLGASCAAALVNPGSVTAGASGSLWGLQSAVIVWLIRFREHLPPALFMEWLRRMLLVTGVNVVVSLTPSVSWEGHFAGGVVGFAVGVFLDWSRWGVGRRRYAMGVLGIVTLTAGMLGGLWAGTYTVGEWKAVRQKAGTPAPKAGTLDPAFVAALEGVQPARWKPLLQSATVAILSRDPGRVSVAASKAREQCAQLRRHVKEVGDRLTPDPTNDALRAYLAEVNGLAEKLEGLFADPKPPSKLQWDDLGARAAKADAAWPQQAAPVVP